MKNSFSQNWQKQNCIRMRYKRSSRIPRHFGVLSSLGEAEFYPGETCESDTAAGDCESRTSRLFSAFRFFDHSGCKEPAAWPVSRQAKQSGTYKRNDSLLDDCFTLFFLPDRVFDRDNQPCTRYGRHRYLTPALFLRLRLLNETLPFVTFRPAFSATRGEVHRLP